MLTIIHSKKVARWRALPCIWCKKEADVDSVLCADHREEVIKSGHFDKRNDQRSGSKKI